MRYALFTIFSMICLHCFGQTNSVNVSITMPSVALVDILSGSSTNVTLPATAPTEAGTGLVSTTNSNNWLIFTSAVPSGTSRSIRGAATGTFPPGIRLKVVISPYTGSGQGVTGGSSYVTGNLYLTQTSTSFIDNIKGAYTGISPNTDGFKLNYSLEMQTYSSVRSGTYNLIVTYTMTDN